MHGHGHFDAWSAQDWHRLAERQREWLPLADAWWRLAHAEPGMRVVDVGCGPGVFAARYAELGAEVTAVDVNARALAAVPAGAGLRTLAHDASQRPISGGPFDVAFLTDMLHHVPDPTAILRNLRPSARRLLVGELDPLAMEADAGLERMEPRAVERLLADASWRVERTIRAQPFGHYAIVAS